MGHEIGSNNAYNPIQGRDGNLDGYLIGGGLGALGYAGTVGAMTGAHKNAKAMYDMHKNRMKSWDEANPEREGFEGVRKSARKHENAISKKQAKEDFVGNFKSHKHSKNLRGGRGALGMAGAFMAGGILGAWGDSTQ